MGSIASPRFYVYILVRPNGKPFYVGKGQGRRVFKHEEEARTPCDCRKCRTIRKVWKQGGQVQRYIVFTTDDEAEALSYECEQIALYGRQNLCNHTDGGDGASGLIPGPETRAKMSAAGKGRPKSPETRRKMSEANRRRPVSPKARERIIAYNKSGVVTPELRAKRSAAMKAKWADPDYRAKKTAELRENAPRNGEMMKTAWADSVFREERKAAFAQPESRARRSVAQKIYSATPEGRTGKSDRRKAAWDRSKAIGTVHLSPEHRAKLSAANKASWARRKAAKEQAE